MLAKDLNFWHLFWQASFIVKIVMLGLVSASIFSWTIIWQRARYFKLLNLVNEEFTHKFWAAEDLQRVYAHLGRQKEERQLLGAERLFHRGFKEFLRLNTHAGNFPQVTITAVSKVMESEIRQLGDEALDNLGRLGTIAAVSPYVGLFGTVWGIMHSFIALGGVEQATLSMVAPGIAESLIATAIGLLVAIPATIAYNRYLALGEKVDNFYQTFSTEFISMLQRKVYSSLNKAKGLPREELEQ